MSRSYKGSYNDNSSRNSARARTPIPERAHLAKYRVIQRDLVYVIGIPMEIASEEKLQQFEYFGQYGSIKKIVVNNQNVYSGNSMRPTVSAYITFYDIKDAEECIYSLENFSLSGQVIKASFGTSKYCSSFLCDQKCNNPDCMYLHYEGDPAESFATDEIQQTSPRFIELTRPTRPLDYDTYQKQNSKPTKFPPRRIFEKIVAEPEKIKAPKPAKPVEKAPAHETPKAEPESTKTKSEDFIKNLFRSDFLSPPPLKVNYSTPQSLKEQLSLYRPTLRSVLLQKFKCKV